MHSIERFFTPFIAALENHGISYCICGNYQLLPYHTDNDIDIWIDNHPLALSLLKKSANDAGYSLYISNKTANGSNNFFFKHYEASTFFLHVDLLTEGAWKSIFPLIPAKIFNSSIIEHKGFKVANDHLSAAMHFIYPLLTLGLIREKYREEIQRYCETTTFTSVMTFALGIKLSNQLILCIKNSDWNGIQAQVNFCRKTLIMRSIPRLFKPERIAITGHFISSVIERLNRPTGLSIVFIGPDGAGKTTTINSIGTRMNKICPRNMFRQLYWRPFLLPELNKIVHLRKQIEVRYDSTDYFYLRQKQINNGKLRKIVYLIKFLYYWLDFVLGGGKVSAITSRGGVVCFDRYYHDQLVYPQRFGFSVNKTLMRFMSRFIYKPDIVFVLCPSSEVLLSRKQEMPLEEVQRQVIEYKKIAEFYNFIHLQSAGSITETSDSIIDICLDFMSKRYDHRR